MNLKAVGLLLFLSALVNLGLRAELEFSAFMVSSKSQLFVIRETDGNDSSGWLTLGQSFRGYTVKSFDQAREVLTVRKEGRDLEIRLKEAKVKAGKLTVEGVISLSGTVKLEGVRVSLFVGEETVLHLNSEVTLSIRPRRLPDGNMLYNARFVIRLKDGELKILSAPSVVVLPSQPFSLQAGEIGYQFTPRP